MGIDLLNFDASIVYQLFLFGIVAVVLIRWMVQPVLATLTLRRRLSTPAGQDAEMTARLSESQARYTELLQNTRAEGAALRQDLREKALAAEQDVLREAQRRAAEVTLAGRTSLTDQVAATRADMQTWVPRMAGDLAGRILGREL